MYSLPVLAYHRIIKHYHEKGKDKIYLSYRRFEQQLNYLKTNQFQTVTFHDIANGLVSDFRKKIILTFDDGYQDNYHYVFPLLKKYGFTAVIFLVTRKTSNNWKKHPLEPEFPLLSHKMIDEMSRYGIEFGGHTCTHPVLTEITGKHAQKEIERCKTDIEQITRKPCISFSYPYGATSQKVEQLIKQAGYQFAVSTNTGSEFIQQNPLRIKRIIISPKTNIISFKNKTSGYYFKRKNIFTLFSSH